MMDVIALAVGFGIGVIVVAIAIEFGTKKEKIIMPNTRRTIEWSINEIQNPKIMAEYLGNLIIPDKAKVLVHKYKDPERFDGVNARRNSQIKGNFVLGDDRALILSGPMKEGELGFWTVEKEIVRSLHEEFDRSWNEATTIKTDKK
ncbi:MAG: hypothetical protein ACXACC_10205 [Promethearchaeota archaeon]|jgi:hypothetical protein